MRRVIDQGEKKNHRSRGEDPHPSLCLKQIQQTILPVAHEPDHSRAENPDPQTQNDGRSPALPSGESESLENPDDIKVLDPEMPDQEIRSQEC